MDSEEKPGAKSRAPVGANVFGKRIAGLGKAIIVGLGQNQKPSAESVVVAGQGVKADPALVKGAQLALDAAVEKPSQLESKLGTTSELHCISLATKNFQGYVLVAYAAGKSLEKKFKEALRTHFVKFARGQGVEATAPKAADIKIQKVDFEKWSLTESDSLIKSVHAGGEIALSFLVSDDSAPALKASSDPQMLMIPLLEIEVGEPLRFDLYLYMRANQKFLLYAKKNAALTQIQKNALVQSGHDYMAVRADAADVADGFLSEQFLNRKIQNFVLESSHE